MSTLADRVPRADGANGFQLQYYGAQARDASWNMRLKTSTYGAPLWGVMSRWVRVFGRGEKDLRRSL